MANHMDRYLFALAISGFVFGILAIVIDPFLKLVRHMRIRRQMIKTKRVRIGDVKDGQRVKIIGRLRLTSTPPPLVAPLTDRLCAYYEARIIDHRRTTYEGSWPTKELFNETRWQGSFWIEDESGRALVDSSQIPQVRLYYDTKFRSGIFKDPPPKVVENLQSRGVSTKGWFLNKSLRYREGALEENKRVVVVGFGYWEPDQESTTSGSYRECPLRLVFSDKNNPLLISNDPRIN
jgi:hypothetical protein